MGGVILMLAVSLLLWVMTVICLRGCNWILISGYSTLPKTDKEKFRARYDVVAMNKYTGKAIFLPMAVICTVGAAWMLFDPAWMRSPWFGVLFAVVAVAATGYMFYAVTRILGDRFKR